MSEPKSSAEEHVSPMKLSPGTGSTNVSARRLKKREIDRRCQRQARERTKSRIAHLEDMVENLKKSDSDERSTLLTKRLADAERERDALAQTLKEVQKAVLMRETGHHGMQILKPDEQDNETPVSIRDNTNGTTALHRPFTGSIASPRADRDKGDITIPEGKRSSERMSSANLRPNDLPKVCNDACECCRDNPRSRNLWRAANKTLLEPYQGSNPITPEEDFFAEDTPVRVILEGWDAVDRQFNLPISWKFLRRIDEMLFSSCPSVERLAILRMMHLLLQYHRDPTQGRRAKLPPWFLPRPSQAQPHAYAIDYFVWPGLRERFIFEQHQFCSNLFWQTFSPSLQISWPYEFRDCFAQHWDSGTYEISSSFRECIADISRWTMKPDFFNHFPVLRCDIPSAVMTPRACSTSFQLQAAHQRLLNGPPGISKPDAAKANAAVSDMAPQHILAAQWVPQPTMLTWMDPSIFPSAFVANPMTSNWVG